jgi:dUTPase
MQDTQEAENANDQADESEMSLAELREAMIEITQHFVKYIITKDEENYSKLKGFRKLDELRNGLEGELDPIIQKYQADMKSHIKSRNTMIKFSLEKLSNAERNAEEESITKISEYQKFQKQRYREIERIRKQNEDKIFDGEPHEKELLMKLGELKYVLLEIEIKLQNALKVAVEEFSKYENKKSTEMIDLTNKFIEPDVQNAFTVHFTSKMEDEFKYEKTQRLENNTELEELEFLE